MMRPVARILALLIAAPLVPGTASLHAETVADAAHPYPEARPFDRTRDAAADLAAAQARVAGTDRAVLAVFGTNACHDSRAFAGWLSSDRFAPMVAARYEVVWIDVGAKDRNIEVARSIGLKGIAGTPTVAVIDASRHLLNRDTAPKWRNAASRSGEEIYAALDRDPASAGR